MQRHKAISSTTHCDPLQICQHNQLFSEPCTTVTSFVRWSSNYRYFNRLTACNISSVSLVTSINVTWAHAKVQYHAHNLVDASRMYIHSKMNAVKACKQTIYHNTQPFYSPFFQDYPGEPVPEEIFFWTFMVQGKITEGDTPTISLGASSSGLISNPPPSSPQFLRRMPFLPQPSHFFLIWERHQICWLACPVASLHQVHYIPQTTCKTGKCD